LGSALLARFEVILQIDKEALRPGDHVEPVAPKSSAYCPRRPPSENRRSGETSVEGGYLCVAGSERLELVTHAGAQGVTIETRSLLGFSALAAADLRVYLRLMP
jgi:hypothetical protein